MSAVNVDPEERSAVTVSPTFPPKRTHHSKVAWTRPPSGSVTRACSRGVGSVVYGSFGWIAQSRPSAPSPSTTGGVL